MNVLLKIGKSFKSFKWYETVMSVIMLGIAIYYAVLPQEGTPQWLAIINFFSGLCGIICVFFCAKANRLNWAFGLINTLVFMIYLWYFGIWATFWLEAIVYFPTGIAGWVMWHKHKDEDNQLLAKSKSLVWWQHFIVVAIIVAFTAIVYIALSALAGDTWMKFAVKFGWGDTAKNIMKWLDSSIFAIGITATALQMLRYKEQYIWWLITDIVAVFQYILKGDAVYTAKKSIYLIEAIVGIKNWGHLAKKNIDNE